MNRDAFAAGKKFKPKDLFVPLPRVIQADIETLILLIRTDVPAVYVMTNDPERYSADVNTAMDQLRLARMGNANRTYGFYEWENDTSKHIRSIGSRDSVTESAVTLEKWLDFCGSNMSPNIDHDYDMWVVKFQSAKSFFQQRESCKHLHDIITHQDDDNNLIRKCFILIGSEPYIPVELRGDLLLLRYDYDAVVEAGSPTMCNVEETIAFTNRVMQFSIRERSPWLADEIKDLTQRQADDILTYLLMKYRDVDQAKLRQYKQDLAQQNELFQYIG